MMIKVEVMVTYMVTLEMEVDRSAALNATLSKADQEAYDLVNAAKPQDSQVQVEEIKCMRAKIEGEL